MTTDRLNRPHTEKHSPRTVLIVDSVPGRQKRCDGRAWSRRRNVAALCSANPIRSTSAFETSREQLFKGEVLGWRVQEGIQRWNTDRVGGRERDRTGLRKIGEVEVDISEESGVGKSNLREVTISRREERGHRR